MSLIGQFPDPKPVDQTNWEKLQNLANIGFVWGRISGGTNTISDKGSRNWTLAKFAAGSYGITFTRPLPTIPVVTLSCDNGRGASPVLSGVPTAAGFAVETFNTVTGADQDTTWEFIGIYLESKIF